MGVKEQFKKQGGLKLIKQYAKGGALFTAVCEFLLLGKSRTALELLRLSADLKIRKKLEKHYKKHLENFDKEYDEKIEHKASNIVWICWFQGMENAPEIVKKCYSSVLENMKEKDIRLITEDNIFEYVSFPDYIIEKWKQGIITHTHMTDLLRLELLIKYGGTWIDATVYVSDSNIESYYTESDLFFFQTLKPGRDGNSTYISSWYLSAKSNNKILMATRELCYQYWKRNNSMVDYFLLHQFMSIVLDYYKDDWNKVIPKDNAAPHILLLRIMDKYDDEMWECIKSQSHFHKLSYKVNESTNIGNSYYNKLCDGNIN